MTLEAKFRVERADFMLDAQLSVPAKGITAVFGPSGCGKTTLLRAMAGLDYHANGFLKVGDLIWQNSNKFVPPHLRSLGYVFQEAALFAHLTIRSNLEYGVKRVPQDELTISLDQVIDLLGIGHLLDRKPHTLSGGERQRVAIARALAVSPRLLLMDEPLASLDQARKQELLPYIESMHQVLDVPIIYVSHSPDEVARLADYLVLLEAGRVTAAGEISEMLTRLDLSLAQDEDAEALIEATVAGHDEKYHLTSLDFAGGQFTITRIDLPLGSAVRLRVAARDVSLSLEFHSGTSILNIFPATIDEIIPVGQAQMIVRLMVGGVPMLARVTRKSAELLGLKSGKPVYAQAKSVAVLA